MNVVGEHQAHSFHHQVAVKAGIRHDAIRRPNQGRGGDLVGVGDFGGMR